MLNLAQIAPQVEALADKIQLDTAKALVNFSQHPLTPETRALISKRIGASVVEIHLPPRMDYEEALRPQVAQLVSQMVQRLEQMKAPALDYIIPPAHTAIAHLLAETLTRADPDHPVGLIWLDLHTGGLRFLGGIE